LTEIVDVEALCAPVLSADEWSVTQVQERLAQALTPFVLDVREAHEYAVSHLPGAVRIGVDEVAARVEELRTVGPIIVYCRSGMRSARARDVLRNHGIAAVSMAGGLLVWRRDIDPQLPVA
jgi:adenylyltransferase/sulfurtransferase